jgi:hypothetical protein
MAYYKAELKVVVIKQLLVSDLSEEEMYETNVCLSKHNYRFYLNTFFLK